MSTNLKRTAVLAGMKAALYGAKFARGRYGQRIAARTRRKYGVRFGGKKRKRKTVRRRRRFPGRRSKLSKLYRSGKIAKTTGKRTTKLSLSFTIGGDGTSGNAEFVDMNSSWLPRNTQFIQEFGSFNNIKFKSVSWKFNNFKIRTILRQVATEGTPPQTNTTEQILEPGWIKIRYKHNKYNENTNPNFKAGNDNRIEENMHTKCITNCHQGFWGKMKIYNTHPSVSISDADNSFTAFLKARQSRMGIVDGAQIDYPQLGFWFSVESTLPKQFFVADPPIVRTAKILVDFDCTVYTKWKMSDKLNNY
ncbi:MAG: putative capsid protein [Uewvirus yahnais]|uniref:Capsid protein n=1 Tax=Cressdnaviricota sp. TaxID=2748378 RepID=A0A345MW33_9VIRU|nr:MAG: putative capsid protein [Cressdnaviricota sp.]